MKDKKEPLADYANRITEHIENARANRAAINRIFREYDESELYPINGRINVTETAIRNAQKFNRETGNNMQGLEYCLFLEAEIIRIVNFYDTPSYRRTKLVKDSGMFFSSF